MGTSLFNRFETFIFVVILTVSISGHTYAQIPGAMNETTATRLGGNNYLTGTVYSPSGLPIDVRMGIRLKSPTAGEVIASTDSRGQFVFSGLVAGSYSVTIDGEQDFEPVSQVVEVTQSRSPIPQTYNVSIRLTDRAKTDLKPGVINSSNAGVPKQALTLYQAALDLSKAGDHNGAVVQLKLALKEFPEFLTALNELGVQYLKLNELEKADEALQAALKIKSDAFEPLVNHGILLFRKKQYADAEPVLRSALKVKDDSAVGHYYLGRTLAGLERFDEAEKELTSAISMGGVEMNEAHRMLANVFIAKREDKRAVNELEIYLTLVPTATDAAHLREVISQLKATITPPGKQPV